MGIVIPKEIRRTLRSRGGDPLLILSTPLDGYLWAMGTLAKRLGLSESRGKLD